MLSGYTHAHCVIEHDKLLVQPCAIIVCWHSVGLIQCHPEWIGIGAHKYLTEYYFLCFHVSYHVLLVCHFIVCLDSFLVNDGS